VPESAADNENVTGRQVGMSGEVENLDIAAKHCVWALSSAKYTPFSISEIHEHLACDGGLLQHGAAVAKKQIDDFSAGNGVNPDAAADILHQANVQSKNQPKMASQEANGGHRGLANFAKPKTPIQLS
jgi:hypothetical protein